RDVIGAACKRGLDRIGPGQERGPAQGRTAHSRPLVVSQGGSDILQAGGRGVVHAGHRRGRRKGRLIVQATGVTHLDGGRGLADGEGSQGLAAAVIGAARKGGDHRVTTSHAGRRAGAGQAAGKGRVHGSEGGVGALVVGQGRRH